jgi:hypothetical protein
MIIYTTALVSVAPRNVGSGAGAWEYLDEPFCL